ncbi:MAG: ATP-binding protein [bacterium]|nr:ATP-binding protein [bacterium]
MIKRNVSGHLLNLAKKYPVVTVTGPRQSGKTTLVRELFKDKTYINLEHPEEREFAKNDPKGFFTRIPDGAVLGEIQRVPELLSYIQVIVDEKKQNGMFILTGSQQFQLLNTISQSLAGRTALFKLLPLSLSELKGQYTYSGMNEVLFTGFYPRIFDQQLSPNQAYSDYFETYVERDLRQLLQVKNLSLFQKFVKLCAGRTGQILNLNSLGNDIGISHTTAREWLTILEAGFIVFLLEPYHKNIRKRLVKSPKIFFYDTGLAAYLLGMEKESHLENHPLRGNLFENLVVMEFLKYRYNMGKKSNLSFYRDSTGNEVDIIYNIARRILAVEVKSGQTVSADYFKGLKALEKVVGPDIFAKAIIYGGDRNEIRNEVHISDYYSIDALLDGLDEA